MSTPESHSPPTIGFLTIVAHAELGMTGGYLVLNMLGRPLEFHCTAPVKTNRTQEILYGPTLTEFLYGEQIGQTLLEKSSLQPLLVCTDVEPALAVREAAAQPVAWVVGDVTSDQCAERVTAAGATFELAGCRLMVSRRHADDREKILELWRPYAENFNLLEPFERIREAISEAQKAA